MWKLITILNGIETDVLIDAKFERIKSYDILINSLFLIFKILFFNFQSLISILVLVISFYFCKDKKLLNVTLYCVLFYILVLILVYLGSSYELNWHLITSGPRVMMSIHYIVFLSSIAGLYKNYRFAYRG